MISNQLYIHVPVHLLQARLPFLLNRKLQPEVACQEAVLDQLDFELLGECAAQLQEQELNTTLHAPYTGFNPGSSKKQIRRASLELVDKSLLLAEKLHSKRVVFHPGLAHGSGGKQLEQWLENSLDFWPQFLPRAKEIESIICIENIYETSPELFTRLLSMINSPQMGHVFDIGHWNMFATGKLFSWLDATTPYLKHLHLHDNHGTRDEHLAIGQGYVPFSSLYEWLNSTAGPLPTITLENHQLPEMELSLQAIGRYLPAYRQQ